jgi:class 3 adenylate cyclase
MRAAHLLGEKKLVTVLFADVVDSVSLAERLDPEDWAFVMNRAFERLSGAITRHGGTIGRLMGDGLLAFFGAPVTHEDDPLRAVLAARDLLGAAREYSCEAEAIIGRRFLVRVGVNTGWAVLGDIGSRSKFEYTAMGDAVNVAARLQASAEPMTALISEDTHRHLATYFDFRDQGVVPIRGRSRGVRAFKLESSDAPSDDSQPAPRSEAQGEEIVAEVQRAVGRDSPGLEHVPPTIQQVIAARLDGLEPDAREVLRLAAIVGNSVAERVLCALAEDPQRVAPCLATLEQMKFLRAEGAGPERTYRFTHALTREVAYATVLRRTRAAVHDRLRAHLPSDQAVLANQSSVGGRASAIVNRGA